MDVELVDPVNEVPEGVVIGLRHFISVPSCPEVREYQQGQTNCHNIVKLTEDSIELKISVIDSFNDITSPYFFTNKFQGQKLCQITTSWWGTERLECKHSSLKSIVVTKHKDTCPHQHLSLTMWCYCEATEKNFLDMIHRRQQETTGALMQRNIDKSEFVSYEVFFSLTRNDWEGKVHGTC